MKIISAFFFTFLTLLIFMQSAFSSPVTPDTIRVLGIRVEFQEDDATTTTGNGKFDLSQPSGDFQIDPPPHNRSYFQDHFLFLKNYFKRVSRGQLIVEGEVFPPEEDRAYLLPSPMGTYNPNTTPELINTGLAHLLRDALMAADSANEIDFSRYRSFVVFHAGVGKDVDLGFDETPQDIPSLFITSDFLQQYLGQPAIQVSGDVNIPNGILIPETESQDGLELGLNGILVSNFGSQLGWLDLFSPVTRRSGIGRFGLMDAGLFNGDGLLPAIPCAWTRIEAGWDQPVDIYYSSNEQWTIHPPLSTHDGRIYRFPINEDEYFLVENRYSNKINIDSVRFEMAQGRNDYPTMKEVLLTHFQDQVTFSAHGVLTDVKNPDLGLPGNGCLIWHIDERVIEQNRAENRVNADPEHRGVDLEEADGSQDIGQEFDFLSAGGGSENGWVLDMWYQGNNAPVFEQNGNKFSPNTQPNSRSYYNRANSHITISDFSLPDSVMTFRVKLDIYQQNFPRSINPQVYGQVTSMKTTDLDFDGRGDILLTTTTGKILVANFPVRSIWNAGSPEIARIPETIITPPVLFDFSPSAGINQKRMVVLTRTGTVYGFRIDPGISFFTLFTPIQCPDSITTPPVAVSLSEHATNVYWGTAGGRVYQLKVQGSELP
ncbi:MAG TPA: hypothetical protein ENK14_07070, partial [Caldithrix sp.]|nr:hypothetical protein [Caldithrix sp.]